MSRFTPRDLVEIQLELECKRADQQGLLYPIVCDDPDDMPRVLVARCADGYHMYLRHDLRAATIDRLRALPAERLFHDTAATQHALAVEMADRVAVWRGHAYTFQHVPDAALFATAQARDGGFAVLVDDQVVSWAWSVRANDRAAELAVETHPAFRRRGYGRQVALAWAAHQQAVGRIAFYSHNLENAASQRLAAALGVAWFAEAISYT